MLTHQRKVLIIEDESDISRILRDYLTRNQYEAAVAATGQDGLQIMELIQPDYIILDIMLPDMDGIEVCREIRRRNNIPILILSAKAVIPIRYLDLALEQTTI